MSANVKDALTVLCKYMNTLVDAGLTVEHLRLARHDAPDEAVTKKLWSTLHILSYHAAREKRGDVDFRSHDVPAAVKLHLAYLQYPEIRFYGLSREGDSHARDLLIALAWLLGTQDVLNAIFRTRLTDSVLGAECSRVAVPEIDVSPTSDKGRPASTSTRLDNILHLNARVNLNLSEIAELSRERASLVSKVHAASIGVSGLPHLSVSELALAKRILTRNTNANDGSGPNDDDDRRRLREFRNAGVLLELRAKWLAKRDVFFNWMITVVQEQKRSMESNPRGAIDSRELARFSSLLHHVVNGRLRGIMAAGECDKQRANSTLDWPSRAYRSQRDGTEEESWLNELEKRRNSEQDSLRENSKLLADELKMMLELIPSSIRV